MDAQIRAAQRNGGRGRSRRRVMAGNIIYCLYLRVMLDSP